MCLRLLVPLPWAARTWTLPVRTALAPAARYDPEQGRRHPTLTAWARPLLQVVRRWGPERALVVVADSTDAALDRRAACQSWTHPVTRSTRWRLDAALSAPPPPRRPGQRGRPRRTGPWWQPRAASAADPHPAWTTVTVAPWEGPGARTVAVVAAPAVW